jgi:hypothetical protein
MQVIPRTVCTFLNKSAARLENIRVQPILRTRPFQKSFGVADFLRKSELISQTIATFLRRVLLI